MNTFRIHIILCQCEIYLLSYICRSWKRFQLNFVLLSAFSDWMSLYFQRFESWKFIFFLLFQVTKVWNLAWLPNPNSSTSNWTGPKTSWFWPVTDCGTSSKTTTSQRRFTNSWYNIQVIFLLYFTFENSKTTSFRCPSRSSPTKIPSLPFSLHLPRRRICEFTPRQYLLHLFIFLTFIAPRACSFILLYWSISLNCSVRLFIERLSVARFIWHIRYVWYIFVTRYKFRSRTCIHRILIKN